MLNYTFTPAIVRALMILSAARQAVTMTTLPLPAAEHLRQQARDERAELKQIVFDRLNYDEKLNYCDRPEQIDGPSAQAWDEINARLGTHAASLAELVEELGRLRFGHRPRGGDAFCGGGCPASTTTGL